MPENDNVFTEKISLTDSDFRDDQRQADDFGIQDTKVLAGDDLKNFLFSSPDDVKGVDDEPAKQPPTKQEPSKQPTQQDTSNTQDQQTKKKEKLSKDVLDEFLLDGPDDDSKTNGNPTKPDQVDGDEQDNTYSTLGKDLLRLGVFTKNSEEETEETLSIDTPEQFLERFNTEKKKGAALILENFLSQFGEDRRRLFDAIFVNGVEPNAYLQSFSKIESMSNLNLEDESVQEKIVKSYYRNLKWDESKIDSRISKLKDYGDLEDEAKTYHEVLLNKEREHTEALEKQRIAQQQADKEKEITTRKAYQRILTDKLKDKDFDGLSLTEKDAQEALSYLSDKKYRLESGELLSEFDKDFMEINSRPEHHELKVKLALLLKRKLDLSSVKKSAISQKSTELFTQTAKNAKQNTNREKERKTFF